MRRLLVHVGLLTATVVASIGASEAQTKKKTEPPYVPQCAALPNCGPAMRSLCVKTGKCMQGVINSNGCMAYQCSMPKPDLRPIPAPKLQPGAAIFDALFTAT